MFHLAVILERMLNVVFVMTVAQGVEWIIQLGSEELPVQILLHLSPSLCLYARHFTQVACEWMLGGGRGGRLEQIGCEASISLPQGSCVYTFSLSPPVCECGVNE